MKIGEVITGVAMMAFMLALCTIETLSAGTLITMAVSGAWIVGYSYMEEEKRAKGGRR
ncbi:MAG: hypothetical protein IKZ00_02895 [Bacteroidaceae bacterium]|nr:hypothetical protein [Bacteroidaceae bacterium]